MAWNLPDTLYVTILDLVFRTDDKISHLVDRRHFPILDHSRVVKALGFVPPLGAYDSFLPFQAFGNCMGGVDSDRSHHFATEEVDKGC